jgi:hypothetical protein
MKCMDIVDHIDGRPAATGAVDLVDLVSAAAMVAG